MRVLHVTPSFYPAYVYGGPVLSVHALCLALGQAGSEVRVLTTDANGPDAVLDVNRSREARLAERVRVRYCHRVMRHAVSPVLLSSLPAVVRWADVVHLTGVYSFPSIPTLIACRLLDRPMVWSPRGGLQRWAGSRRIRIKSAWDSVCGALASRRLAFHATSEAEAEDCRREFPCHEAVVVPNGVEVPRTCARAASPGPLRLAYLGRLDPKKGIENLLRACHRLSAAGRVAWSLTIAGMGDARYTHTLRALIETLSLQDRVRMVGEVLGETKQRLLCESDVLVVPSHVENFAMVVTEALAHGLPVIASRGTPWQRLDEVGCGLWVSNAPESLAAAIEQVCTMPFGEMGARGREWMMREFAWESVAARMGALYERLVGNGVRVRERVADG